MLVLETIEKIRQASIAERIQIIELILQSLKQDINIMFTGRKPQAKPFKVRKFNLGREIPVDRDRMYSKRGV